MTSSGPVDVTLKVRIWNFGEPGDERDFDGGLKEMVVWMIHEEGLCSLVENEDVSVIDAEWNLD